MEPITYRTMRQADAKGVMELWTKVFGESAWYFQTIIDGDAKRKLHHTQLAVDASGRPVSAVHIVNRQVWDASGVLRSVGSIANVATYEEARKKGHSGKLLEMAIARMEADGHDLSWLFTGVHDHHRRYGWFDAPLRIRRSDLDQPPVIRRSVKTSVQKVARLNMNTPLVDELAPLFSSAHIGRPLTHKRSGAYWRAVILPRLRQRSIRLWIASSSSGKPIAYLVGKQSKSEASIIEAGWSKSGAPELGKLVCRFCGEIHRAGLRHLEIALPEVDPVKDALEAAGLAATWEPSPWSMARVLAGGVPESTIQAMFGAPHGHHFEFDNF